MKLRKRELFPKFEPGFRCKFSTDMALIQLVDMIQQFFFTDLILPLDHCMYM